ncbi:cytochrome P450 [Aaosphaeria arxii CBS 175.79]|uniref:Cytochrome P450 n=1 Tax=Aaosphaeria arxii CBS 175.79 TaxID=1450172 RepID=A0A6A5XTR7_9PLEO|nr:cytochrome P450 [Aaosphaeria arxii CBS 175.79]KAF2016207.1 cytochrome P450 [Aaosphaeria arxii CBS 175.79]
MATTYNVPPTLSVLRVLHNVSVGRIIAAIFTILIARFILRGIQRVYFHPLSKFPGPKLSAFTRIPHLRARFKGEVHLYLKELHEKHGEVVRVSPDELSFINPNAWKDIYGHGTRGTKGSPPPKDFSRFGRAVNGHYSLIATPDNGEHYKTRRMFSPAFSDRALKDQEPLFIKYVDQLVSVLRNKPDSEGKFDMVRMYNFTTFDVMGDLTFGEPLHMLDNAEYDPWVSIIFKALKLGSRLALLHHYPILYKAYKKLVPEKKLKKRYEHFQYCVSRVTKRLEKGRQAEGVDLWSLILDSEDKGKGLSRGQMDANASLFMVAGTETTATLVSGFTYFMLKNPTVMKKLQEEIRGAWSSSEDINMEVAARLPYLNACIKEAFRKYPPVAIGLPHRTPKDGSTICGDFVPPDFTVAAPHLVMYNSPSYFKDPELFVPDRWLGDERYKDDVLSALQPFSVGSRDCLGKNMAYHEMRLILTKVFYNFDLELCPESDDWVNQKAYVLWDKPSLMVKVSPAQNAGT